MENYLEFKKHKLEVKIELDSKLKNTRILAQRREFFMYIAEYQQVVWCLVPEVGLLSFIQRVCAG